MKIEMLTGVLRALIAAGAGSLAGKGFIEASQVDTLTGAALLIITTIWSVIAKSEKFPSIK